MKTQPILLAAILALALPATLRADPMDASSRDSSRDETTAERGGERSFVSRVVRYPFRVGYTVVRAPLIVGETMMGQRTFVGRHGFFAADEDQRRSLTMRRVAFAGDTPDND